MAAGFHPAARSGPVLSQTPTAAFVAVFVAIVAAAFALMRLLGRAPWTRKGAIPPACAAGCFAAGVALGVPAGERSAAACTASLRTGDALEAVGTVRVALHAAGTSGTGAPAGGSTGSGGPARGARAPTLRLTLENAVLRRVPESLPQSAPMHVCRVSRLVIHLRRQRESLDAGASVRIRGEWWRFPAGGGDWPRQPDRWGRLFAESATPTAARPSGSGSAPRVGSGPAWRPQRLGPLDRLRIAASNRLRSRLPPDVEAVGRALLLSERADLDRDLARRFADAGLAHVLSISGMHVGIIAGGLAWMLGFLGGPRRFAVAAACCAIYVVAIGAPPAAVRAVCLFGVYAAARMRGSPVRMTDVLGAAGVFALLRDPLVLTDVGFQLSFAGFGGLLVGGALGRRTLRARPLQRMVGAAGRAIGGAVERVLSPLARRHSGGGAGGAAEPRIRSLVLMFAAGAGAFAFTAPIAAAHFQRAAPIALVSNFVGGPIVALALGGLVGAVLLPGAAGELAGDGAAGMLRLLEAVVSWLAGLPLGHGDVLPPSPGEWAAVCLVLFAGVRLAAGMHRRRALFPLACGAVLWIAGPVVAGLAPGSASLFCSFDVGQGDAAAIRTRRGHWLVFDAGPRSGDRDAGRRVVAPFLARKGALGIDLLLLSHPHLDHMGGALALLDAFHIDRVLDAGNPVPDSAYGKLLRAVRAEGAAWLPARPGLRVRIDEVEVLVLAPLEPSFRPEVYRATRPPGSAPEGRPGVDEARPAADANEASVAVRVEIAEEFVYLNTGDASAEEEAEIMDAWPAALLDADVLKLGHHGSRTSSAVSWLRAVSPEIAVVSAGSGNRYGHPHAVTLERLDSAAVPRVWRTDRLGTLCIEVGQGGRWRMVPP